jgi:hypothetical protein
MTTDQTQVTMIRVTHWGRHDYFPTIGDAQAHVDRNIELNAKDRADRGEPFNVNEWRSEFSFAEVERQHQPCKACGGEAQNSADSYAEYPYCRMCFYTGRAANDINAAGLASFREAFPDAEVGVEHTGGGCFWLAFRWAGDPFYYCATDGEASLPEADQGGWASGWGIACRYHEDDQHDDYEGAVILDGWGKDDEHDMLVRTFTIEQVVAAIRADREARNA